MTDEYNSNLSDAELNQNSDDECNLAEDEYADFDEVCELQKALIEYAKIHNLSLCENLTIKSLCKFLQT